jgi:ubiquinone biosynthesis protein Coq4
MKDLFNEKIYELSKKPYQKFIKKGKAWDVNVSKLIQLPTDSLGYHLGCFLLKYNFEIQPKLEDHDVIHVLTNTGISVEEEIGMQYYLFGNGKQSFYLIMVILSGTLFYPTRFNYFIRQYQKGKTTHQFYELDFLNMLSLPITTIQQSFNIKTNQ